MKTQMRRLWESLAETLSAHPLLVKTVALAGGSGLIIAAYRDYQAFLALGRGGIPYNAFGWLINALILRPLALSYSARLYTGDYPDSGAGKVLLELPLREGRRPMADGIIPHRQMTDKAPEAMAAPSRQMMLGFLEDPAFEGRLEVKKSHYELHNDALYVKNLEDTALPALAPAAKGEIMHVHPDRSIHVYLHPADARVVIAKGWGERHRLSRTWPWWMGRRQQLLGVGHTWIMLYGARDEYELATLRDITAEGVKWMLGDRAGGS
ncbi:uncharacterized protein AB675_7410 [Cyphellophora attinorum]|uniref:Luciferase domain-containing protein n=1 Tax=Cyphellophora attinorum TaxID=1664694 RepID=A0A0N0NHG3_9EURO|nr:uncharacterized protein AB675_7410 [Phialophora attinorum]KPI34528.1 hypothetical protein AB675_7410 [Phialophora attinorum]